MLSDEELVPWLDIACAILLEIAIIIVKKVPFKIRKHPEPDLSLAAPRRFKVIRRQFAMFYFFAVLPILLIGAIRISKTRQFHMVNVLVGYFISQFLTALTVDLMKLFLSRPRPDTHTLCGGQSSVEACAATLNVEQLRNQFRSHPSGGTAEMVAVGVFCTLTLHDLWPNRSFVSFLMKFAPMFWAFFSGAARIVGHAHHPEDVASSMVIGGTIGYLAWKMILRRRKSDYVRLPSIDE